MNCARIEALKQENNELKARNEALRQENNELKARNEELEKRDKIHFKILNDKYIPENKISDKPKLPEKFSSIEFYSEFDMQIKFNKLIDYLEERKI